MTRILKRVGIFLFILVCVFFNNVYAEKNNNINFQSMTIDDGLSQSLAEYIYQDSYGYIWIGTSDGLNRYNGSEFKIYKNSKSNENTISNNVITSLVEDNSKNLWIGTYSGLNKMNLVTGDITRYLISQDDKNSSNSVIEELMVDSKERLWVCSISSLNLYDSKNDKFIKIETDLFNDKIIQDISEDHNGVIWISTDAGLYRYNPQEEKIEKFNDPQNIINDKNILTIYYSNNKLWLGTKTCGLIIMDLNDYSIKSYQYNLDDNTSIPSNFIIDILRAKDGSIWLATDQGLALFDEETESFYTYKKNSDKYSICDDNIINLYEDRSGGIWIGTYNGISNFYINKEFKVYRNDPTNNNSLNNSSVCGIYEDDDGMIWVGTFNSGVNKINRITGDVTRYYNLQGNSQSLSSNRIKAITGIDNEVWIATDNGLNKYDRNTGTFTTYNKSDSKNSINSDEVRALFIDKEGLLWIGTKDGLCSFDRKDKFVSYNEIFVENGIYEKVISAIYEDSEGIMWIGLGADGGLVSYNRKTGEIKNYLSDENNLNSLSFNTVRAISEDSNGMIWIGTQSGLNKFDKKSEKFTSYTYMDGLSNDFIYGVIVDNSDNVWVSTNYGISIYDQVNNKFIRYQGDSNLIECIWGVFFPLQFF